MIYQLIDNKTHQINDQLWFPDPPRNGILKQPIAIGKGLTVDRLPIVIPNGWNSPVDILPTVYAKGGDLSVERLKLAYSKGFYLLIEKNKPAWYCPLIRFVIFTDEIHISKSMAKLMRQNKYEVTINEDFERVINACSSIKRKPEYGSTWIVPEMIDAYTELYRLGLATSVEVWKPNPETNERKLVGGLYGVSSNNNAFFGESAFHAVDNASKLAFIYLAKYLKSKGVRIIDCQMETPLSKSMGGRYISYNEYMDILQCS